MKGTNTVNYHPLLPPPPGTARAAKDRNAFLQCCAQGCTRYRDGLNLWCRTHVPAAKRYGHPSARPLSPTLWKSLRLLVAEVFEANANHEGLKQATAYIESLLLRANQGSSANASAEDLSRLSRYGITAADILREVCAFWSWQQHNTRALPSQKAWDFAMSRAVFALAPRPVKVIISAGPTNGREYRTKPRTSALNHLGAHLRAALGPLLVAVYQALEDRDKAAQATLAALRVPLAQPTSTFIAEAAAAAMASVPILAQATAGLDKLISHNPIK